VKLGALPWPSRDGTIYLMVYLMILNGIFETFKTIGYLKFEIYNGVFNSIFNGIFKIV
jgi:hypothetical protein